MSKWQPIETAPKDGAWILIGFRKITAYGTWIVSTIRLDQEGESGWFGFYEGYGLQRFSQPSHWMPVPHPPKEEAAP